jgi:rhamnosyltransferase
MTCCRIPVQMLGQSGCRLSFPGATVYLDPYLSNSVQILDAPDLERQIPIPIAPEKVTDADIVLITHEHIDHCDPHTLPIIAQASPQACFIGPAPVLKKLSEWGIAEHRLALAQETWQDVAPNLRLHAIPAAHPEIERDTAGQLACVGYLIDYAGQKLYLAGDTMARQKIIDTLCKLGPLHTAFLPVNEHNFFRGRRGIIGNMSVREAFQFALEIGAQQVVAVHWDMFASNAVDPDEIRLIHKRMNPDFGLLIGPTHLNLGGIQASIIIRTLNEARHLDELLRAIASQTSTGLRHEVILVDSGSTDGTLKIAEGHGCRIQHISREEFSFGRSLNIGCEAAHGDILVITSGHCVPTDEYWLQHLCQPLLDGQADYAYGRQYGGPESHYSEHRIFAKYFPAQSKIPQAGFYCNNANAALHKSTWQKYRFDEELTGLEDMGLTQRLVKDGGRVAYIAEAGVYHHHSETWPQVRRRFEREAIALQRIMPQVHVGLVDTLRYTVSSVWKDWHCARKEGAPVKLADIARYRWNQYIGALKGNHEHRKLSHAEKEKYFFPE